MHKFLSRLAVIALAFDSAASFCFFSPFPSLSGKKVAFRTPLQLLASLQDHADLSSGRRSVVLGGSTAMAMAALASPQKAAANTVDIDVGNKNSSLQSSLSATKLVKVTDPQTYSALAYSPPLGATSKQYPLLVVLPGAGLNAGTAWDLADPAGEHVGLPPSLLATGRAPAALADNFAVLAPYSAGSRSLYEEPRSKLLSFLDWACSDKGRAGGCPLIDPERIYLLGFSDGATLGVELLTTGRFRAGVIAAYGFTGTLPSLALERLADKPLWIFHSADDVIFPVKCSDNLVDSLRKINVNKDIVRYTRYSQDQEGFTGRVRGHSTGITASKLGAIYEWMLSV